MATKKFKALPKKAQRAAFAEMDDSGTRTKKGDGNVQVKTLKKNDAPYRFDPKTGTVSHLTDIRARRNPRTAAETARIKSNLAKFVKSGNATSGMKALNAAIKKKK